LRLGEVVRYRQYDGKIKETPPHEVQAIEMAWTFAGASVGSRAARKRKINVFKPVSGTLLLRYP
jgi:hypothetical protein